MVDTLTAMCGPGCNFQNLTNTTQNKTTRGGVDIEIHRLGPKSDKCGLGQRDSEDTETSREFEMLYASFASYAEVTVVRQYHGAFASCPAWARS